MPEFKKKTKQALKNNDNAIILWLEHTRHESRRQKHEVVSSSSLYQQDLAQSMLAYLCSSITANSLPHPRIPHSDYGSHPRHMFQPRTRYAPTEYLSSLSVDSYFLRTWSQSSCGRSESSSDDGGGGVCSIEESDPTTTFPWQNEGGAGLDEEYQGNEGGDADGGEWEDEESLAVSDKGRAFASSSQHVSSDLSVELGIPEEAEVEDEGERIDHDTRALYIEMMRELVQDMGGMQIALGDVVDSPSVMDESYEDLLILKAEQEADEMILEEEEGSGETWDIGHETGQGIVEEDVVD